MAQQIRELMTPNPVSLPGTASVREAAHAMRDADIGDVIVIAHNQICDISAAPPNTSPEGSMVPRF